MSRKKINDIIPDGEGICFKCPIKIDKADVSSFYGVGVNWFYCKITPPTKYYGKRNEGFTSFRIDGVDDFNPRAVFPKAMERSEATRLCREFIRTIPRTGLKVEHFLSFFKKIEGARFDW